MVATKQKGFADLEKRSYVYPYPVYYRSPVLGAGNTPSLYGRSRSGSMGLTTVIRDYGTEILNAIRENDVHKLKFILEKTLRSDMKIARLCVTDIKHKPTKKFACPLILAARQEDPRIMKYMMDKGTDPNFVHHTIFSSKRREILTALHITVDLGFYNVAEVLLNANADSNIYDHNRETPLHIAVKKADHTMVRMLLSKGADPSIPDNKGNGALHIATLYGHLQMVRSLLKYDADIYQRGQWDAIPPHIAAKEGHIHLLQLFCSRDIGNINIKIPCYPDRREKAPIHLAAENGHTESLLVLLDQFDADVNLKDSDGNTALHCVVLHPYDTHRMRDKEYFTESARVLIRFRVSINEKNAFGDTALHFAAMNHYHRIVELLLEMGANPSLENEDNLKPLDTVPDSDPVTKQMLKMAMLRPRPTVDNSLNMSQISRSAHRLDMTHGFSMQDQLFNRGSKMNMSQRSGSSMSSFYADGSKMRKSRSHSQGRDSHHSRDRERRSRSHDPDDDSREEALHDDSVFNENTGVYNKVENEIPVYTKVDPTRKKHKQKGGNHRSKLDYDQREWEEISTTTMNDHDDSSVFTHDTGIGTHDHGVGTQESGMITQDTGVMTGSHKKKNRHQQTNTVQTSEIGTQQNGHLNKSVGTQSPAKEKKKKPRKHSSDPNLDLDTPIPQAEPVIAPTPAARKGEVIYENLPPAIPQPPPVPPRKARQESQKQDTIAGEYKEEDGVQVHTVPGRPSTIEVQYGGGPITISVATPKDYEDDSNEDSDEVSHKEKPNKQSPKHKRNAEGSPKHKKKHPKSPPSRHKENRPPQKYEIDEERTPKSPKRKTSPSSPKKREPKHPDEYPREDAGYYNSYYDQKAKKKKPKSDSSKKYDRYYNYSSNYPQTMDDQENEGMDVSEISMMSMESQPELVKQIIQQKVAEITDEEGRRHKSQSKKYTEDDHFQGWSDDDDEEEDEEHILDSDEWQSAEEELRQDPQTAEKPQYDRNQWEDDAETSPPRSPKRGQHESHHFSPQKQNDPHRFLPPSNIITKPGDVKSDQAKHEKGQSKTKKKKVPTATLR